MEKTHKRPSSKLGKKNWLKHNMKAVLIAFFEKQKYRKLNFFQFLDTIAVKILSLMTGIFS